MESAATRSLNHWWCCDKDSPAKKICVAGSKPRINPRQRNRTLPQFAGELRIACVARRARRARAARHLAEPLRPQIVATLHARAGGRLQGRPGALRGAVEERASERRQRAQR